MPAQTKVNGVLNLRGMVSEMDGWKPIPAEGLDTEFDQQMKRQIAQMLPYIRYDMSGLEEFLKKKQKELMKMMQELKIQYGVGGCPALGGNAAEIGFRNCPCEHYDECLQESIVPICCVCARKSECFLQPTQSCSLFEQHGEWVVVGSGAKRY